MGKHYTQQDRCARNINGQVATRRIVFDEAGTMRPSRSTRPVFEGQWNRAFLQRCVLLSILLGALGGPAAAKNTVLRCQGYQPDDRHKLTEEIITLDIQNNIAISIQLDGIQPKDVINAPIKNASKDV